VDVNALNCQGWTALHLAANEGHLDIVKFLACERNVDINVMDYRSETVFHGAARHGHLDILKCLFDERQVDVNLRTGELRRGYDTVRGSEEMTALHHAAKEGHLDIVKWLVENGADLAQMDGHGWTPPIDF